MKTILLSLTAAAALAAAVAPASAQFYGRADYAPAYAQSYERPYAQPYEHPYAAPTSERLDRLDWKITDAVRDHQISWWEGRDLHGDLRVARALTWRVDTGRASGWDRQRLERTVARIEGAVDRYAQNERYDWRER